MTEFRYNDVARRLDEALDEDLKVAAPVDVEPPASEEPGLLRLGRTSIFDDIEAGKLAAHAGAGRTILEHQVGNRLRELDAEKTASLNRFIERAKEAASRLDKEVLEGNVTYSDVDPSLPKSMGRSAIGKAYTRDAALRPTVATPDQLSRKRTLDSALFRNAHRAENADWLHNAHVPGIGPATGGGQVHAPSTSGQFLRTFQRPFFGKTRAALSTASTAYQPLERVLTKRHGQDSTLNRAILEHELGEKNVMSGKIRHDHASHAGVEPILRENLILKGDHEAAGTMQAVRRSGHDDALVQRLVKQVGGTPESPLPVGGRHQRALERRLEANAGNLAKDTRRRLLGNEIAMRLTGSEDLPITRTLPNQVRDSVQNLLTSKGDTKRVLSSLRSMFRYAR